MALRFGSPAHPDGGLRFGTSAYQELGVVISSVTTDGVTGQIVPGLSATILVGEPIGATQGTVRLKANGYTLTLTIESWDDSTDTITVNGSRDGLPYGTGATLEVELNDGSIGTQTVEIATEANVLYFDCTSINDTHENSIWNAYIAVTAEDLGTTDSNGDLSTTLSWTTGIKPESVEVVVSTSVATDDGAGNLTGDFTGTIDYATSAITITGAPASTSAAVDYERKIEQPAGDYQAIVNDPNGVGPEIDSSGVITSVASNGTFDLFVYDKSTGQESTTTSVTANLNPPQGQVTITDTTVSGSDVTITWSYDDTDITGWGYSIDGGAVTEFGDDTTTSYTITGLADGSYSIEIIPINDGGQGTGTDTTTATVDTSAPPVLDSEIPDQSGTEGNSFSLDLSAYFSGATSYSITGFPTGTGLTLDSGTGVLSGTLTADDAGTNTLTATATNTDGSESDSFDLVVQAVTPQSAPVLESGSILVGIVEAEIDGSYPGDDADSFEYEVDDSGDWVGFADFPFTVTDLNVGTQYSVKARAVNAGGTGPESTAVTFITRDEVVTPAHPSRIIDISRRGQTFTQWPKERWDYDVAFWEWLQVVNDTLYDFELYGDTDVITASYVYQLDGEDRVKLWIDDVTAEKKISVLIVTGAGRRWKAQFVVSPRGSQ